MWRELFDKEPPVLGRHYLTAGSRTGFRNYAYGGLKPATRAKLDALADAARSQGARKRDPNGPAARHRA